MCTLEFTMSFFFSSMLLFDFVNRKFILYCGQREKKKLQSVSIFLLLRLRLCRLLFEKRKWALDVILLIDCKQQETEIEILFIQ